MYPAWEGEGFGNMPVSLVHGPDTFSSHHAGCGALCQESKVVLTKKKTFGDSNDPLGTLIGPAYKQTHRANKRTKMIGFNLFGSRISLEIDFAIHSIMSHVSLNFGDAAPGIFRQIPDQSMP